MGNTIIYVRDDNVVGFSRRNISKRKFVIKRIVRFSGFFFFLLSLYDRVTRYYFSLCRLGI